MPAIADLAPSCHLITLTRVKLSDSTTTSPGLVYQQAKDHPELLGLQQLRHQEDYRIIGLPPLENARTNTNDRARSSCTTILGKGSISFYFHRALVWWPPFCRTRNSGRLVRCIHREDILHHQTNMFSCHQTDSSFPLLEVTKTVRQLSLL